MSKTLRVFFLMISISIVACDKDELTYNELRSRMHGTYLGSISDVGQVHQDQEIVLTELNDSLSMVIGNFYDLLVVKVITADLDNGLISCRGDSILSLIYTDNHKRLHIQKDNSFVGTFMGQKIE